MSVSGTESVNGTESERENENGKENESEEEGETGKVVNEGVREVKRTVWIVGLSGRGDEMGSGEH